MNKDDIRGLAPGTLIMAAAVWTSETPELFAASRWDWVNQAWLYLVAELLPDGRWDWAAWSSDSTEQSLHGVTEDQAGAMAQAEEAATSIGRLRIVGAV